MSEHPLAPDDPQATPEEKQRRLIAELDARINASRAQRERLAAARKARLRWYIVITAALLLLAAGCIMFGKLFLPRMMAPAPPGHNPPSRQPDSPPNGTTRPPASARPSLL